MSKSDLWDIDRYTISSRYSDLITTEDEEKNMIVIEDAPSNISLNNMSDLILVYNNYGELAVIIDRVHRNEHNIFRWWYVVCKLTLMHLAHRFTGDKGVATTITKHKEYIDMSMYKKWWIQWLDDIRKA